MVNIKGDNNGTQRKIETNKRTTVISKNKNSSKFTFKRERSETAGDDNGQTLPQKRELRNRITTTNKDNDLSLAPRRSSRAPIPVNRFNYADHVKKKRRKKRDEGIEITDDEDDKYDDEDGEEDETEEENEEDGADDVGVKNDDDDGLEDEDDDDVETVDEEEDQVYESDESAQTESVITDESSTDDENVDDLDSYSNRMESRSKAKRSYKRRQGKLKKNPFKVPQKTPRKTPRRPITKTYAGIRKKNSKISEHATPTKLRGRPQQKQQQLPQKRERSFSDTGQYREKDEGVEEAIKYMTVPREGTPQWNLWEKLQGVFALYDDNYDNKNNENDNNNRTADTSDTTITTNKAPFDENNSILFPRGACSFHVLYHLVQARLAAGMLRSSIKVCHDMLISMYKTANDSIKDLPRRGDGQMPRVAKAVVLRANLAGVWCVYAHVIVQLGAMCEAAAETNPGVLADKKENKSSHLHNLKPRGTKNISDAGVFWDYAVQILVAAASCPLVGNHASVALALSRLLLIGRPDGYNENDENHNAIERIRKALRLNVGLAIDVCWDAIDRCSSSNHQPHCLPRFRFGENETDKQTYKQSVFAFLDNYQMFDKRSRKNFTPSELMEGAVNTSELQKTFDMVAELPQCLRNICMSPHFFADKRSTKVLCNEMNRLSRLGEKINNFETLQLIPAPFSASEELDDFFLFRTLNVGLLPLASPPTPAESARRCNNKGDKNGTKSSGSSSGKSNQSYKGLKNMKPIHCNVEFGCTKCHSSYFKNEGICKKHERTCSGQQLLSHSYFDSGLILNESWLPSLSKSDNVVNVGQVRKVRLYSDVELACTKCKTCFFTQERKRNRHEEICNG